MALVFDVLLLQCLGHSIFLTHLLVLRLGICLLSLLLGQVGSKVGFNHLQDIHDGSACSRRLRVLHWGSRLLHTLHESTRLGIILHHGGSCPIVCTSFNADLVHLRLCPRQGSQLGLQVLDLS